LGVSAPALQSDRLRLGPIHNPVRGFLHGSAAVACVGLADHLGSGTGGPPPVRSVLWICVLSQLFVYLASSFYHAIPWGPTAKRRMQRLDHSMIYVGIAGSLTPFVWLGLGDWRRDAILAAAWSIAALGALQKLFLPRVPEKLCIPFQLLQAALVLPALAPFAARFPGAPIGLLGAALACYLTGALVFVTERPRLWPRVFSYHELFHVCTVAASAALFATLLTSSG
jgi:hemolysin III